MSSVWLADRAAGLCRRWVRLYTRRLDDDSRERRRGEIESDLYEHRAEASASGVSGHRLAAEILSRVLVGVPADLSWRRASRQPQKRLNTGGGTMSTTRHPNQWAVDILGGIIIAYAWGFSISGVIYVGLTEGIPWDGRLLFWIVPLVSGLLMLAGLRRRRSDPRSGLHLITAALVGPCIWFWFLPFYGPLAVAMLAVTVADTPRKRSPEAATIGDPTSNRVGVGSGADS